jgi:ribose 1,5-bisphosphokinase
LVRADLGRTKGAVIAVSAHGCGAVDAVLDGVRRRLARRPDFAFPRRIITGPVAEGDELHQTVTAAQFEDLSRTGRFFCRWSEGGRQFALPASVRGDLTAGRKVVVAANGGGLSALCAALICPVVLVRLRRAGEAAEDDLPAACETDIVLTVGERDDAARLLARRLIGLATPLPGASPTGMPGEPHLWV